MHSFVLDTIWRMNAGVMMETDFQPNQSHFIHIILDLQSLGKMKVGRAIKMSRNSIIHTLSKVIFFDFRKISQKLIEFFSIFCRQDREKSFFAVLAFQRQSIPKLVFRHEVRYFFWTFLYFKDFLKFYLEVCFLMTQILKDIFLDDLRLSTIFFITLQRVMGSYGNSWEFKCRSGNLS